MPYIKPIDIKDASWHISIDFILLDTSNGLVKLLIAMTNFNKYDIHLLHFFLFLFYFLFCCSCVSQPHFGIGVRVKPTLPKVGSRSLPELKKTYQIARLLWKFPEGSQEYRRILFFFLPSYLLCSQIWLKLLCGWSPLWLHHKILKRNAAFC